MLNSVFINQTEATIIVYLEDYFDYYSWVTHFEQELRVVVWGNLKFVRDEDYFSLTVTIVACFYTFVEGLYLETGVVT